MPPPSVFSHFKRSALAVFFTLFWCGITGTFDFLLIRGAVRQLRALDYPVVQGEVVESRLVCSGKSHRAEITTRFTLDGKSHLTRQYRYDAAGGMGTEEVVARHRAGSRPWVHYRPDDPDDAILEAGLQGQDGFLLLFMTPFNLVGLAILAGWIWPLVDSWKEKRDDRNDPLADSAQALVRIRPDPIASGSHALLTMFIGPIVSAVLLGVTGLAFRSFWIPFGAWLALVALATFFLARGHRRNKSGDRDLVIDRIQRLVILPATHGQRRIFLKDLTAATAISTTRERRKFRGGTTTHTTWYLRLAAQGMVHDIEFDLESSARSAARRIRKAARLRENAAE